MLLPQESGIVQHQNHQTCRPLSSVKHNLLLLLKFSIRNIIQKENLSQKTNSKVYDIWCIYLALYYSIDFPKMEIANRKSTALSLCRDKNKKGRCKEEVTISPNFPVLRLYSGDNRNKKYYSPWNNKCSQQNRLHYKPYILLPLGPYYLVHRLDIYRFDLSIVMWVSSIGF